MIEVWYDINRQKIQVFGALSCGIPANVQQYRMKRIFLELKRYLKPRLTVLPEGCSMKDPAILLATWFGAGLIRPAPGTFGSLAAIPVGWLIYYLFGLYGFLLAILLIFPIGVYAAQKFDEKSGAHDSSSIVIDEVIGMWIAAIPAALNIWVWAAAFILFRLFDIWKPWPVWWADEDLKGGFGVMSDDVLAGIYALLGTTMITLPFMGVLYV